MITKIIFTSIIILINTLIVLYAKKEKVINRTYYILIPVALIVAYVFNTYILKGNTIQLVGINITALILLLSPCLLIVLIFYVISNDRLKNKKLEIENSLPNSIEYFNGLTYTIAYFVFPIAITAIQIALIWDSKSVISLFLQ